MKHPLAFMVQRAKGSELFFRVLVEGGWVGRWIRRGGAVWVEVRG